MAKEGNHTMVRMTAQTFVTVILAVAGVTGVDRLIPEKAAAANPEATAHVGRLAEQFRGQEKLWVDQAYKDRDQDSNLKSQTTGITSLQTDMAVVQQRLKGIDEGLARQGETLLKILDRLPPR